MFYLPQIYDVGPTALLPPKKGVQTILFPKNPTSSSGFETANLGTKGQHATRRPPAIPAHLMQAAFTFLFPIC